MKITNILKVLSVLSVLLFAVPLFAQTPAVIPVLNTVQFGTSSGSQVQGFFASTISLSPTQTVTLSGLKEVDWALTDTTSCSIIDSSGTSRIVSRAALITALEAVANQVWTTPVVTTQSVSTTSGSIQTTITYTISTLPNGSSSSISSTTTASVPVNN